MTSVAEPYPQPNVPETKSGSRKKKALALLLLLGIAASTFLAVRYLQTGKPISKIAGPMVPAPVQSLLQSDPVYVDSRWDITRPLGVAAGPNGTMYVMGQTHLFAIGANARWQRRTLHVHPLSPEGPCHRQAQLLV